MVGGPYDGRREKLSEDRTEITIYRQVGVDPVEEHRYVRERLFVAGAPLDFYRHDGITAFEALTKVLEAYGK